MREIWEIVQETEWPEIVWVHETLDMMILAAPVAVMALAGLTALCLMLKWWRTAVVMGVLCVGLNVWTEQIPVNLKRDVPTVKPEGTLRVLEYNICGKKEFAPLHGEPFVNYVKDFDADFLFLPENTVGVAMELDAMLQREYPYSVHSFEEFEQTAKGYADYTLYSRYPLSNFRMYVVDKVRLQREHPFIDSLQVMRQSENMMAYEATADVGGHAVTLLHLHMRSNNYDSVRDVAPAKRDRLPFIYNQLLYGYAFRKAEAEVIRDSIGNCPNPLIICGDLNDLSGSRSVRMLQDCRRDNVHADHRERLKDAWWEGGQGLGFTFADQHLRLRLDHILYSKEFVLQSVSVLKPNYSDHRPLVADFVFNPRP